MTRHRAGSTRRTTLAIFATAILATLFTNPGPAHAAVFTPACTPNDLLGDVGTANSNGENDVIRLPSNCSYDMASTLSVSQDLQLGATHRLVIRGEGDGATITQSAGSVRLFVVENGANVVFRNVTLSNGAGVGTPGGGGAIYIAPGGTARLEASRVVDNHAGSGPRGGGIFNDRGTLTVVDSTLVENGGAVEGGAIANDGKLTVTGARFFRNRARGGGAISNSAIGKTTVVDSVFGGNIASIIGGGAIRNQGSSFTVSGSTFSDNVAPGGTGGALLNASGLLTLTDSTVSSNGASNTSGGGIANGSPNNSQAAMVVDHSTISDNSGANGGGIYNAGRMSFSRSDAAGNGASGSGGGIYSSPGKLSITDSVVWGNNASGTGGGISQFGRMDVVRSTFSGNTSGRSGGGISSGGNVAILDSILSDNLAKVDFGGAIFHAQGTLELDDSRLTGNDAPEGGALFVESGTTNVAQSVISNNRAVLRGGGVKTGFNARFTVEDSTISMNTSGQHGGGLYNNGGILPTSTGKMVVRDSTVSDNRSAFAGAGGNGGGFYNQGRLELIDSTVADNATGGAGGGVDTGNTGGAASLTLLRTKVLRNQSAGGGGISTGGAAISITESTVMDNTSSGDGGGIAMHSGSLTVLRSTIANNAASGHGGGIRSSVPLTLTNVTLANNRAAQGGAINWGGAGFGTITHATIVGNIAPVAPSIHATVPGVVLVNSIVAGPAAPQCVSSFAIIGTSNLSSLSAGCASVGTANALAHLGPLADNGGPTPTMALVLGPVPNLAIDAGDVSKCPPTDQRGLPRPQDGPADLDHDAGCDRGAYEWQ